MKAAAVLITLVFAATLLAGCLVIAVAVTRRHPTPPRSNVFPSPLDTSIPPGDHLSRTPG